jgi:hypothetical protein
MSKSLLNRILNRIHDALLGDPALSATLARDSPERAERSLALSRLVDQLYATLARQDEALDTYTYLHDLYAEDNGALFAILSRDGKLYRAPLAIAGDTLALGEMMQVVELFAPVAARSLAVKRQSDGRFRWVAIAGTAILNRSGELDSRELFENFVRRAEETGRYPRPDFFHLREAASLGPPADFVAASGVTYIASGVFDDPDDNPLVAYALRALEREPDYWGTSIEFRPIRREMLEVLPDVSIPVYVDGENEWISMLPEHEASHLMTSLAARTKEIPMNQRVKDALARLLENDEELLRAIEERADGISRTVETEHLISRETAETAETAEAPVAPAEPETPEAAMPPVVELDDDAVGLIAAAAAQSPAFAALLAPLQDALEALQTGLAALSPQLAELSTRAKTAEDRLALLERDEEDKQRQWIGDLPGGQHARLAVTYRPKVARGAVAADDDDPETMADIAKKNLNGLPSY